MFIFHFFHIVSNKTRLFHDLTNRSNGYGIQADATIVYSTADSSNPAHDLCQHQPVLGFKTKEPFLYDTNDFTFHSSARGQSRLPDIITQATLECFYGS